LADYHRSSSVVYFIVEKILPAALECGAMDVPEKGIVHFGEETNDGLAEIVASTEPRHCTLRVSSSRNQSTVQVRSG